MLLLPSHEANDTPAQRIESATLAGDAAARCVWIDAGDGTRFAALWPHSYTARFGPLRVYDAAGREVWRAGEAITVDGGLSDVHVDRIPGACRRGDLAWWVAPIAP